MSARRAITLSPLPTSRRPARFSDRRAAGSARRSAASRGSARWWPPPAGRAPGSGAAAPPANQLLFKGHSATSLCRSGLSLPARRRECRRAGPSLMGGINDEFIQLFFPACSASSRALTCSGEPEISEDSRRAMRVGRLPAWRAKATACASLPTVHPLAVLQPRRPTPRPAAPARRR